MSRQLKNLCFSLLRLLATSLFVIVIPTAILWFFLILIAGAGGASLQQTGWILWIPTVFVVPLLLYYTYRGVRESSQH